MSSASDWYNGRKHDPEFLKCRAERSRKYRERVGRPVVRAQERTQNTRLLEKVLDQHGRKCNICGFDKDQRILQLDHVNGGGNQERRQIGTRGIRRNALESPEQYQILCPNCNWTKRFDRLEQNPRKSDSNSRNTSSALVEVQGQGTE